jgi:hypothetical protein
VFLFYECFSFLQVLSAYLLHFKKVVSLGVYFIVTISGPRSGVQAGNMGF